jgi:hypothetical protein
MFMGIRDLPTLMYCDYGCDMRGEGGDADSESEGCEILAELSSGPFG